MSSFRRVFAYAALVFLATSLWGQAGKTKITLMGGTANPGAAYMKSFSEMMAIQEVNKKFDVELSYRHPLDGNDLVNQLNLMVASRSYPDVFEDVDFGVYAGGIDKAYADKVILKLNDLIDKNMPNLKSLMQKDPRFKREMMNDKGEILGIKRYDPDFNKRPYQGFMIRQDWLDKLGLKKPETIQEVYSVLKAFKGKDMEGKGKVVEYPYLGSKTSNIKNLSVAWGVQVDAPFQFDAKTGKVVFGKATAAYRDYLNEMIKWRNEGLFNPAQIITDATIFESQAVNGEGAMWVHYVSRFVLWQSKGKTINPDYDISGLKNPLGPAGKRYGVSNFNIISQPMWTTITTNNKNVAKTLQVIDYYFSPEGSNLLNWGIEGKTYKVENGVKKFTIDVAEKGKHIFMDWGNPRLMDVTASMAAYNEKQLAETKFWVEAASDYSLFLPNYSLTDVEAKKLASIMNDINTLTNETVDKILVGMDDTKLWDSYVKQVKSMKLDDAVKIVQTAVDRYLARK